MKTIFYNFMDSEYAWAGRAGRYHLPYCTQDMLCTRHCELARSVYIADICQLFRCNGWGHDGSGHHHDGPAVIVLTSDLSEMVQWGRVSLAVQVLAACAALMLVSFHLGHLASRYFPTNLRIIQQLYAYALDTGDPFCSSMIRSCGHILDNLDSRFSIGQRTRHQENGSPR